MSKTDDKSKKPYKKSGDRVAAIRKRLGKTEDEIAEEFELVSGGKYWSRFESGTRRIPRHHAQSLADLLHDGTRVQWILGEDDYETEADKAEGVIIERIVDKEANAGSIVERLIRLHGYKIEESLSEAKTDEEGRVYQRTSIALTAPSGKVVRYLSPEGYNRLLKSVNDYLEGQLLLLFKKRRDGGIEYYGGIE